MPVTHVKLQGAMTMALGLGLHVRGAALDAFAGGWIRLEARRVAVPAAGAVPGRLLREPQHQPGLHHQPAPKNNAARANRKGGQTANISPQPLLLGQPWAGGWVWKVRGSGRGVEAQGTPAAPHKHTSAAAGPAGASPQPEAVVRMRKQSPAQQRRDVTSSQRRGRRLPYLPGGVSETQ